MRAVYEQYDHQRGWLGTSACEQLMRAIYTAGQQAKDLLGALARAGEHELENTRIFALQFHVRGVSAI
jgi:hypothetical protein